MRIAFASCTHIGHFPSPRQTVWGEVAAARPDWLVLLGDNIYMDYFPGVGWPRHWPLERFARTMHARYAAQYQEHNFNALIRRLEGRVVATWDDHDFAWNNANGGDLSVDHMKVTRALFGQFQDALLNRPADYPPLNLQAVLAAPVPAAEIYRAIPLGQDRLLVTDGRTYRRGLGKPANPAAPLLGDAQERWLLGELNRSTRVHVVASGSTLGDFPGLLVDSAEAWCHWETACRRFFAMCEGKKVIFLGGDIHENRFATHTNGAGRVFEAVSSGAALRKYWLFGRRRNFGILDLGEDAVQVDLYEKGERTRRTIDPRSWMLA